MRLILAALTELDRLNYQTIRFFHLITGGWAQRFQANLTYFLGPTLVGPTATRASEASATFGFDSVKQFHMNKLIFLIENNYHDNSCDGVMTDLT